MRRLRLILALCAFFVPAAALSACGSGVSGDSVADMAGNPISTQAFNHWLFIAAKGNASQSPGAPVIIPNAPPDFKNCITQVRKQIPTLAKTTDQRLKVDCARLFTSLGGQVLDFLIRAYWYQAEAAKHHITITDAQVQQALQAARKQQFPTAAGFSAFLAQSGQTMGDILFRVRINQILKKLLALHSATVNPAAIQAYYTSHSSQFGTPQSRDLRIVRTGKPGQAAAALKALRHRQSWKQVAKRYSIDTATKNTGGLLSRVTQGQQEQALDKAAFSAPVGKLLGPIHGTFGYYVVQVIKIRPATKQSLAKATPLIRQILVSQGQQTAQMSVDAQVKKDWLPKTKCRSTYAMADCSGFKAPKASSTLAPGQGQTQTVPAPTQAPSGATTTTK